MRLADQHGHARGEEFVDESLSAYTSTPRPAFQRLIQQIAQLRESVIVVWHIDRLYRQPRELEQLLQLAESRRIRIDSVHGGTLDLSTHEGRMFARYLVAFAHYESAHKAARVARAHQQRARQGLWHGAAAYGYRAGGRLEPWEATTVRRIVTDYLSGCSFAEIARRLNARGIPTPARSAAWHATTVRSILASDRLHRVRTVGEEGDVVPGVWESIVSPEESELVRTLLLLPQRPNSRSSLSLLGGMATCAECGNTLSITYGGSGSRIRRYICRRLHGRGCGNGIAADSLDKLVAEYIDALVTPPVQPGRLPALGSPLSTEAAILVETRRELLLGYGTGRIGRNQYANERQLIADQFSWLLDKVNDRTPVPKVLWDAAGIVDRRSIVQAVISTVGVTAPRQRHKFDPGRVIIVPKMLRPSPGLRPASG